MTKYEGNLSLQNSFQVALKLFEGVPSHAHREMLVISASLTNCDPDDIGITVEKLVSNRVQVNAISIAAKTFLLDAVCDQTRGRHLLALDKSHLTTLLKLFLTPSPTTSFTLSTKIPISFPRR